MSPDDFRGLEAEKTFGSGVPTEQIPFEPDGEKGVLFRVGREEVKSLSHFFGGEAV
jgi:hypothetical protein